MIVGVSVQRTAKILFGDVHKVMQLRRVHGELWEKLDELLVSTFEDTEASEVVEEEVEEAGKEEVEVERDVEMKEAGNEEGSGEEEVEVKQKTQVVKVKAAREGGRTSRAPTLDKLLNKREDQAEQWERYSRGVREILEQHHEKYPKDFAYEAEDQRRVALELDWLADESEEEEDTEAEAEKKKAEKAKRAKESRAQRDERELKETIAARRRYGKALRENMPLCTKTLLRIVDERLTKIPNTIIEVSRL